jgi:hypothetical protein
MTKEKKEALLQELVTRVLDEMLAHSDKWPEEWDGFELRWLAETAFSYEAPSRTRASGHAKRYKEFKNILNTKNLY